MKPSFNSLFRKLSSIANQFDDTANQAKSACLKSLSKTILPKNKALIDYSDLLIFLCSHSANSQLLVQSENELKRITAFLKRNNEAGKPIYQGSGLPLSDILTRFSHDLIVWMLEQKQYQVTLDAYLENEENLNDILKLTLPAIERERTSAGLNNKDLLDALYIQPKQTLCFLAEQLAYFNAEPLLKDYLFDALEIYTKVNSKQIEFSRAYNRLKQNTIFYHSDILKKFDHTQLLNTSLPDAKKMNESETQHLSYIIKTSLVLMSRETDPATYMDENSLRLYELERGISVAIYGMLPNRQLPLESYIGYTLFKNGFPTAYGGCWIFGERSLFGINIFEPFRGGESGYVMCQLLRVYRQVFGINYFEVEPYQFGKDNPDGIASGAYWFYHRYGFRSVDKEVHQLSEKEVQKIKTKKGYRSSPNILKQLAESFLALNLGSHQQTTVTSISEKVSQLISKQYNGKRALALNDCAEDFITHSKLSQNLNQNEKAVLNEMASLAAALKIKDEKQLGLLREMVITKPKDVYKYQSLLRAFLCTDSQ